MVHIKDFEEKYLIDLHGTVYSIGSGKILKPYKANGYLKVDLYKDGKRKKVYIHQLLYETFRKKTNENYETINHKDGNKLNNSLSNLEGVSYRDNIIHSNYVLDNGNKRAVIQIDPNNNKVISRYRSIAQANRNFKRGSGISNCCRGINNTAHGFKWEYED